MQHLTDYSPAFRFDASAGIRYARRGARCFGFLLVWLLAVNPSKAQIAPPSDTLHIGRLHGVAIGLGTGWVASMVGLSELWYKEHRAQSFHFFDDSKHWLQMDKTGHVLTGYQVSQYSGELFRWSGVPQKQSALLGGGVSLLFLTGVEVFDGLSEQWGFSASDVAANIGGVALFTGQEFLWGEQRIIAKFSYTPTDFAALRPETLGATHLERVFKDYNGQRVWLTFMPKSFGIFGDRWPEWLGVSFGYGASGLLGGDGNPTFNATGAPLPEFERRRRFFLGLDIDTRRIPTKSGFLRSVFGVIGFIKVPSPAVEWSDGEVKGHFLMF